MARRHFHDERFQLQGHTLCVQRTYGYPPERGFFDETRLCVSPFVENPHQSIINVMF